MSDKAAVFPITGEFILIFQYSIIHKHENGEWNFAVIVFAHKMFYLKGIRGVLLCIEISSQALIMQNCSLLT